MVKKGQNRLSGLYFSIHICLIPFCFSVIILPFHYEQNVG
jgi:hypothetical protein